MGVFKNVPQAKRKRLPQEDAVSDGVDIISRESNASVEKSEKTAKKSKK